MSILSLTPHAVGRRRPQILYATVSARQPAPTSFDQSLFVTEPWNPDHDREITGGIPAIHGGTLPAQGAEVMLAFDAYGNLRCIGWDGPYSPPSSGASS